MKGYGPDVTPYITQLVPPISVTTTVTGGNFVNALEAAEEAAAIKKARMGSVHSIEALPTPTPTPHASVGGGTAQISKLPTPKAPPPSPTPAPLYGAVYTGGNPPATLKVGQAVTVPVTVQNTSSQTWPAGGVFHLAFHWLRGGVQIVHDGDRTLMPTAVAPGATVNLSAKVTAPPSAGAMTLQWDMVQENVAWFSDKGVPMSAPHNVNVTP